MIDLASPFRKSPTRRRRRPRHHRHPRHRRRRRPRRRRGRGVPIRLPRCLRRRRPRVSRAPAAAVGPREFGGEQGDRRRRRPRVSRARWPRWDPGNSVEAGGRRRRPRVSRAPAAARDPREFGGEQGGRVAAAAREFLVPLWPRWDSREFSGKKGGWLVDLLANGRQHRGCRRWRLGLGRTHGFFFLTIGMDFFGHHPPPRQIQSRRTSCGTIAGYAPPPAPDGRAGGGTTPAGNAPRRHARGRGAPPARAPRPCGRRGIAARSRCRTTPSRRPFV